MGSANPFMNINVFTSDNFFGEIPKIKYFSQKSRQILGKKKIKIKIISQSIQSLPLCQNDQIVDLRGTTIIILGI